MGHRLIQIEVRANNEGELEALIERITSSELLQDSAFNRAAEIGAALGKSLLKFGGLRQVQPQAKPEGPFCALCNQQIGYDQTEVVFHLDGKCR